MTAVENTRPVFDGNQIVATSFYGLGGDASIIQHVHMKWGSTTTAVITFWSSNFLPEEAPVNDATAGNWIQEDPPTGYTAISPAGAATVGANPLTITIPGGTAGGCSVNIGNIGSKRLRIRVVCTVAGQLRVWPNGKY